MSADDDAPPDRRSGGGRPGSLMRTEAQRLVLMQALNELGAEAVEGRPSIHRPNASHEVYGQAGGQLRDADASHSSRRRSRRSTRRAKRMKEALDDSMKSGGEGDGEGDAVGTVAGLTESGSSSSTSSSLGAVDALSAAVHIVDAGLGLALVTYGSLVEASEVTAVGISYGLLLLLGSVAGMVGYYKTSKCGLMTSAAAGVLIGLANVAGFILALASWETFREYLAGNYEELLLTEEGADTVGELRVLFVVLFFVLAVVEEFRAWSMYRMYRAAAVDPGAPSDGCCHRLLARLGVQKEKKIDDFVQFDDETASMERSLLWSEDAESHRKEDYLDFVPGHERGLADFAERTQLPRPPADRTDY